MRDKSIVAFRGRMLKNIVLYGMIKNILVKIAIEQEMKIYDV